MRRSRRWAFALFAIVVCCNGGSEFGTFEGKVQTEWVDEDRSMRLLAPFKYIDPGGEEWVAPEGSVIDGASIPRMAWSAFGGPFTGKYRNASVIHDVACVERTRSWESVHEAFYWAMRASGVKDLKAKVMYGAVYHFGPRWSQEIAIDGLSEEDTEETVKRTIARAPIGSKAEIVDERGRVFHHEDILEHREQPTSRLKTLRLAPPERRITRDQFENLEEQIERQAAIKPEGMSLEEIRSFRP